VTWEFCTEPDFEEKLEWTRAFVRDEVMPLEVLDLDDARLRELIKPLQEEVRKQRLWAAFLPPHLGGSGWGQVKMALLSEILGEALWAPTVFGCSGSSRRFGFRPSTSPPDGSPPSAGWTSRP
jgi:acyl-CoA dehydrogenase